MTIGQKSNSDFNQFVAVGVTSTHAWDLVAWPGGLHPSQAWPKAADARNGWLSASLSQLSGSLQ
jgi:hypothetical protein